MLTAARLENIRRAGTFLGPALLGVIIGNTAHAVTFGTPPAVMSFDPMTLLMNSAFAIFGAVVTWGMRTRLDRAAWTFFTLQYAVPVAAALITFPLAGAWSTALTATFAVLATASGARTAPRRVLWSASAIFIALAVGSFSARYYADGLLGKHSVVRGRY